MPLNAGQILAGKYRVESLLGEGGMGSVFIATNTALQRQVALKVMSEKFATMPAAVQRFHREAIAASKVSHPSIVQVFDAGTHEGAPWIAMELLEGESLGDRLIRAPMGLDEVLKMAFGALSALAEVHDQGIIHRDLKPDNIFLATDKKHGFIPKVLDFGVAKDMSEGKLSKLTATGAVVGTAYYLSPEQAKGLPDIDARADVYAMGVVLFECLSGKMPYEADTITQLIAKMFTEPPRLLAHVAPSVPSPIADVVTVCLQQDRDHRFPTARGLLEALETADAVLRGGAGPGRSMNNPPSAEEMLGMAGTAFGHTPGAQVPSAPGFVGSSRPGVAQQTPMPHGMAPGSHPGMQGSHPGMQQGSHPGMQQGSYPGMQPGSHPGMQPGSHPGMQPGSYPGMQQGSYPGSQEGSHPGMQHGSHPGMQQGVPMTAAGMPMSRPHGVPQTAYMQPGMPGTPIARAAPEQSGGGRGAAIALVIVLFLVGAAATGGAVWFFSKGDGGSDATASADAPAPADAPPLTDTTPADPSLIEPTLAEPTLADPTPADPTPADPTPADPTLTEAASPPGHRRRPRPDRTPEADPLSQTAANPTPNPTPDPTPQVTPTPNPRPNPDPNARPIQPREQSGLSSQQVQAAINGQLPMLQQRCYARRAARVANLQGVITVSWTVRPDGRVTDARVVHNGTGDEWLARCTQGVVQSIRFPAAQNGLNTSARHPFMFSQ